MRRHLFLLLLPLVFSCGQKKAKEATVGGVKAKPIPGLTAPLVHDNFTRSGFKLDTTSAGDVSVWTSVENNEMHEFKVATNSTKSNNVISVQASVVSMLTLDQSAKDFLASVASVPYKFADPQKAKDWVLANLVQGGSTTIGDVTFQLTINNETSRTLKIYVQ
jgi:hypothetical protein